MAPHDAPQYDLPPTERLLTINEIADRLAISRDTVYRVLVREIPSYRVGERLRFKASDVDAYVERNRTP
jgi:putative molybdopterin biosynthesis protein